MTRTRWRRIARGLLIALWAACWCGWVVVCMGEGAVDGLIGCLVAGLVGRWFARHAATGPEQDYEALSADRRAIVDEALAAGDLRGPITLRQVERDLAKVRLAQGGPTPRARALWLSLYVALFVAALVFAPSRPPWLIVLTVLALAGAAALVFLIPRPDPLAREERRRLKAVSKTPLDH